MAIDLETPRGRFVFDITGHLLGYFPEVSGEVIEAETQALFERLEEAKQIIDRKGDSMKQDKDPKHKKHEDEDTGELPPIPRDPTTPVTPPAPEPPPDTDPGVIIGNG